MPVRVSSVSFTPVRSRPSMVIRSSFAAVTDVTIHLHTYVHGRQKSGPVTVAFLAWPYGILFADANTWVVRRDAGRR